MTDDAQAEVEAIAGKHRRVAAWIIAIIFVLYFGLILMIALAKPFLTQLVAPGLSLAILLGAIVTVSAWILTIAYVWWANRYYDPLVRGRRS